MIADGITPDELVTQNAGPSEGGEKRQPRPAKYRFTDFSGYPKKPGPAGRMPKPIAREIAAGATLESFLI